MKVFDNALIVSAIDKHKENIFSADIGMSEDWYWTAEPIFKDGQYTQDLTKQTAMSGGINGSYWATPIIRIETKDNQTIDYPVFSSDEEVVKTAEEEQVKFRNDNYESLKELLRNMKDA